MRDVRCNLQAVMSDIINKLVAQRAPGPLAGGIAEDPQAPIGRSVLMVNYFSCTLAGLAVSPYVKWCPIYRARERVKRPRAKRRFCRRREEAARFSRRSPPPSSVVPFFPFRIDDRTERRQFQFLQIVPRDAPRPAKMGTE